MNKIAIATALLTLSMIAQAQGPTVPTTTYRSEMSSRNVAKTGDVGVGLIIGSATGVDLKWWASENSAWRPGVVWNMGSTAVLVDYLYHFRSTLNEISSASASKLLAPYFGIGAIAAFGNQNNFFTLNANNSNAAAVRVPLGIEFLPQGLPVGVFAELIPGLGVAPSIFTYFQADVGAHYYF